MKKSKRKKRSHAWLLEHIQDPYVKQAQKDGYRSRAAYKLEEIDAHFGLIRPGQLIVDLGSTPGAWSQYLLRRLRSFTSPSSPESVLQKKPHLFAVDLLPMMPLEGIHFIQGDFGEESTLQALQAALPKTQIDVILSDMAPDLTGIASSDSAKVEELVDLVLAFCVAHLHPNGSLVIKLFHGSGYSQCVQKIKAHFLRVKAIKPKASRSGSAETFVVALQRKTPRIASN